MATIMEEKKAKDVEVALFRYLTQICNILENDGLSESEKEIYVDRVKEIVEKRGILKELEQRLRNWEKFQKK